MELEVLVKFIEKQKTLLEREAYVSHKKVITFAIAENEHQFHIRKSSLIGNRIDVQKRIFS